MATAELLTSSSKEAHAPWRAAQAPANDTSPRRVAPLASLRRAVLGRRDTPVVISIGVKILMIVAVGLAALGGAIGVQFYANTIFNAVTATAQDFRRIDAGVDDVRARLFEMELIAIDVARSGDEARIGQFDVAIDSASDALTAIERLDAAADGEVLVASMRDGFATVGPRFAALIDVAKTIGFSESEGLSETLFAAGAALERELKLWPNIADIMAKLAEARRFEQALLIEYADESAGRLNKAISELDFILPGGPFGAADQETLLNQLGEYRAALNAMRDAADRRVAAQAELDAAFAVLEGRILPLRAFATEGLEQADVALADTRSRTTLIFVAGGVLAGIVFTIASLFVARSIVSPIRRITVAMQRLAAGDHETAVPGLSRKDEIGKMANAIAVFKDNAFEIERFKTAEQETAERAAQERRETLQTLADDFERSVRRVAVALNDTAGRIGQSAMKMASDADASETEGATVAELIQTSATSVLTIVQSAEDLDLSVKAVEQRLTDTSAAIQRTLNAANDTTALVTRFRMRLSASARSSTSSTPSPARPTS